MRVEDESLDSPPLPHSPWSSVTRPDHSRRVLVTGYPSLWETLVNYGSCFTRPRS